MGVQKKYVNNFINLRMKLEVTNRPYCTCYIHTYIHAIFTRICMVLNFQLTINGKLYYVLYKVGNEEN